MMTQASCSKCAFFDDHNSQANAAAHPDGLCRYNPPVTQPSADEHGLWPVVSSNDWCGHFSGNGIPQVAAE